MSDELEELLDQLENPEWSNCSHHLCMEEAATTLRRYREALEEVIILCDGFGPDSGPFKAERIARQALKEPTP